MQRIQQQYQEQVVPAMMERFGYKSIMQVPRIEEIVANVGVGEALQSASTLEHAVQDLTAITGQKPIVTRARKSIAAFRLREGSPIGTKVTLRGERMWSFYDRLVNIALPRQRDFQGVPSSSFDGRGNYTLGLREQLVFVEVNYDSIDKVRGLEITIVTTAETDEEARFLLEELGMPFARNQAQQQAV